MIKLTVTVSNPFSDREWESVKTYSGVFSKHKAWEVNLYQTRVLAGADFAWTRKCDHAGINLFLGLFGYTLELHYYDTRHWDYENKCWEVYE